MRKIQAVALTRASFRDYGQIMSEGEGKAASENEEFTYWGKVARFTFQQQASAGVLVCRKRPAVVRSIERHLKTPEVLINLDGDCLICLARPGEGLDELKAFRVRQGQAFALHAGTWHWIPFPLRQAECRFLVIFRFGTEEEDLEVKELPAPVELEP